MKRKKINWLLSFVLSVVLFCLPLAGNAAGATETSRQSQTIVISLQQYNDLKTQFGALELNLTQLKANSEQDKERIATLEKQLKTSQTALDKAASSLTIAKSEWQTLNDSLPILTRQITSLKQENERLERQRNIWAVAAGCVFVYSMIK